MNTIELSICIPTYEMHGMAEQMLIRNFDMLTKQTFKNFEVIIADNSEDDVVKNLCLRPAYQSLNIHYFKNPKKGLSPNANAAMEHAKGMLIKILHMDDYLADENSLLKIIKNFKGHWLVTGCGHDTGNGKIIKPHFPKYNRRMFLGKNTIGSPSVLTIKNEKVLLFDEKLSWLNDCDYYTRLYALYGEPTILNDINVIIGIGTHQTTNNIEHTAKKEERIYLEEKYKHHIKHVDIILDIVATLKNRLKSFLS